MEILLEYYQDRFPETDYARGQLIGYLDEELRFVAVFGDSENNDINDIEAIDKMIDYNGDHAFLKSHPDFLIHD